MFETGTQNSELHHNWNAELLLTASQNYDLSSPSHSEVHPAEKLLFLESAASPLVLIVFLCVSVLIQEMPGHWRTWAEFWCCTDGPPCRTLPTGANVKAPATRRPCSSTPAWWVRTALKGSYFIAPKKKSLKGLVEMSCLVCLCLKEWTPPDSTRWPLHFLLFGFLSASFPFIILTGVFTLGAQGGASRGCDGWRLVLPGSTRHFCCCFFMLHFLKNSQLLKPELFRFNLIMI